MIYLEDFIPHILTLHKTRSSLHWSNHSAIFSKIDPIIQYTNNNRFVGLLETHYNDVRIRLLVDRRLCEQNNTPICAFGVIFNIDLPDQWRCETWVFNEFWAVPRNLSFHLFSFFTCPLLSINIISPYKWMYLCLTIFCLNLQHPLYI